MGYVRWDDSSWDKYASVTSNRTEKENFASSKMHPYLDPMDTVRESRDSDLNPESTAIMVGCDVTASMGMITNKLVSDGLGTLFAEILDRKPVTDPHLLVGGIGDVTCDTAPIQVSQFEADISIADQLEKIYIEHGGGGNSYESYDMFVYYAAFNTSIDCFEKRGKKGYLFTIGDEQPAKHVLSSAVSKHLGGGLQSDMPFKDLVDVVNRMYNYYHIIIAEGHHCCHYGVDSVKSKWVDIIGQNTIVLDDHNDLSEVIVSIIEINEGKDVKSVAASWDGSTALVVSNATKHLSPTSSVESTSIRL